MYGLDFEKELKSNVLEDNPEYEFYNGFGGFVENGKEYEILLDGNNQPPAPWINVIANNNFGFHISESGAGFTWASNSRENKITPWSNDPVSDNASEAIYIKDEMTGHVITPVSLGRKDKGIYRVRHGFGYSAFFHEEEKIKQKLTVLVPVDESVKLWELELTNTSDDMRYLSINYYVEWVLGVERDQAGPYVVTSYDNEHEYLSAKSIYNYDYRKHNAYIFSSEMIMGYTGDRKEFLGAKGSVRNPEGLHRKLSCNTGAAYDSCGVIRISIALRQNETKTVVFGLGYTEKADVIAEICNRYKDVQNIQKELTKIKDYWDEITGKIQVRTSDRAIDILVNGWLLYQTVSCRINARAAFYQCGGAYGFRDQIQDAMALLYTRPDILKKQIITASSRQFEEGDVQHWWHPPTGVGVRTRITDDLLWLPYATAAYIECTGDFSILEENVNYIKGAQLNSNQKEAMIIPEVSDNKATVYEHCKKTIMRTSFGIHGLPLMGGGDWNDGMNEVGIEGKGESVWLAWFFYKVLEDFLPVCYHEKDVIFAEELEQMKKTLKSNIEQYAWDGDWYIRAFYDDGTKMGSKESDECKIDSISQSWSVISKCGLNERARKAVQSAVRYLVIEKEWISLLLAPPFNKTEKNPGYIKNYYPGIRENGGQYTHAAVWLAISTAMLKERNLTHNLFTMLNPINITSNKKDALKYEKEPYVMTADISFGESYTGRGGWSWYTGSAGWMYQGLVKWFLGITKEGEYLVINPSTPQAFGDYTVYYQYGQSSYEIKIEQQKDSTIEGMELTLDGEIVTEGRIRLNDDKKNHMVILQYKNPVLL